MYIGIDLGTTGCKVVLFSPSGEILQEYNKEYEREKIIVNFLEKLEPILEAI